MEKLRCLCSIKEVPRHCQIWNSLVDMRQEGKKNLRKVRESMQHNVRDGYEESWGQRMKHDQVRQGGGNQFKELGNDIEGNEGPLKRSTRK